jgi:hypothetical protein
VLAAALLLGSVYDVKRYEPVVARFFRMLGAQSRCVKFNPKGSATDVQDCNQMANALLPFLPTPAPKQWNSAGNVDCVFLGTLQNKHGDRLVILNRIKAADYSTPPDLFIAHVIRPGSLFRQPRLVADGSEQPTGALAATPPPWSAGPVVVSLGIRDGRNCSRFSVSYSLGNHTGVLEGRLDDDDQVHLVDKSSEGIWIAHQASHATSPYDNIDGPLLPCANQ